MDDAIQNGVCDVWLPQGNPDRAAATRLFCFHYAGGNSAVFRDWQPLLAADIHVCPVELPGHGTRLREAPSRSMTDLVDRLEQALSPWLTLPFSFFGHSMGAAIAFELTHRLRTRLGIRPECLFVAGRRAPGRPVPPAIHGLPEPLFIEEIRGYSGTPEEVLSHPEILAVLLPMLRADFALIETAAHVERRPLDCPVVAFGGLEDSKVNRQDVLAWRELTSAHFSMEMLAGNHFFLHRSRAQLLKSVSSHLLDGHAAAEDFAFGAGGGR